ncbi:MAG: TIR domain-containing protein [Methylococcales bacterium]
MKEYKILLVEDELVWCDILKHHIQTALDNLKITGDIQVTNNLEKAWDIFEGEESWDLLCTDIALGDEFGDTEGTVIVSRAAERKIPTVIVSGTEAVTTQLVRNFLKVDKVADFFAKKNFDDSSFVRLVEKLLAPTRVFICYAHADNEDSDPKKRWLERLEINLKPFERQGDIMFFSDKDVKPGENWHERIQHELNNASSAVLLVSKDFLASDYIANSELPVLLKNAADGGLRVFPIIISPCSYERITFKYPDPRVGPNEFKLSSLQAANPPSMTLKEMNETEQDRVLLEVAKQLLEI